MTGLRARSVALVAALGLGSGCDDTAPPVSDPPPLAEAWVELVTPDAWASTPAADDPLGDHAPPEASCPEGSWLIASGIVDVDTGTCSYLSVAAPASRAVAEGALLRWRLWHLDLFANPPATAHVALLVDDDVWWEREIAIPSAARLYDIELRAPQALKKGALVRIHLHNHGVNEWRFAAPEIQANTEERSR